jgi:serine/threonine protein kinase
MIDTINGLHRMHHGDRHALLHRDLKPKNMLVYQRQGGDGAGAGAEPALGFDPDVSIKLGDFGLAKELEGTLNSLVRSAVGTGTLLTMAPEATGGNYGAHGDVFAWGVTMCMVACQTLPDPPQPLGSNRDAITELGVQLLRDACGGVGDVVEHSLELYFNKRPCSTEVRDRLLQAAGLWPTLGETLTLVRCEHVSCQSSCA